MQIVFELHILSQWRQRLGLQDVLFGTDGQIIFADYQTAQTLAEKLSRVWRRTVPAGDLYAMGLIEEILHVVLRQYEMQNPGLIARLLDAAAQQFGAENLDETLLSFVTLFPPQAVYQRQQSPSVWLEGSTAGRPNREIALEELLMLWLANENPAFEPYRDLFSDAALRRQTAYLEVIASVRAAARTEPGLTSTGETMLDVLRAPLDAAPASLSGQLDYLLRRWGAILGEAFLRRVQRAQDFLAEEQSHFAPPAGGMTGETPLLSFDDMPEYERFSEDRDWMPRLVLLAKNTYVWLAQLSRQYGREMTRLDQIPDEELDTLAACGFTGLWLIGLWERSRASRKIKQLMGQSDAVASAYSLYDYVVADDLGGQAALENLRWRAWQRGIRLAADMVPNHMGLDSRWVIEHPEWFLSLDAPPYPNYTFNGPDLSDDERVGIFLEDHYYDHSDAAVVFKRLDRWTGAVRYIYHGNDGTSMPWNDTAQLNYLKAEVREQVIQTILAVAREFPVIRFDAAMTLAKKHIQRLWFPEPGQGGAIPSRAAHGLTKAEFNAAMPQEFWREVVDRVAAEVPDTLLLAEAFWLMEGYFVRTLGMHRVYNSAFMHMTRDEENAKYRQVMKNTLEFDPQVLKRYVNFMNNPDEETAAVQYGTTDKYFGVATLLATLPGLPMFGHGQVEGFREKYGMEFRRPQWDEPVDEGLVRGHEYRIFPLLHRRYLFAEVTHFLLYDFFTAEGGVNEDVFAYSNRHGDERALVVYHNKYAQTSGWVKISAAYRDKTQDALVQKTLAEGLALPQKGYVIFRDLVSGQEYIRSCAALWREGLFVSLEAYQAQVFLDFRFVDGTNWALIADMLNGRGVPSLDDFYKQVFAPAPDETVTVEAEADETVEASASAAADETSLPDDEAIAPADT